MKCTTCGLPLSPIRNNKNCPRCGAPVLAGSKSTGGPTGYEPSPWDDNSTAPTNAGPTSRERQPGWNQADQPTPYAGSVLQTLPSQYPLPPRRPSNDSRIGFIVAGLCVVAGGILLVLVYFLAVGQPGHNTSGSTTTPASTHTSSSPAPSSPTSTPSPTSTTYPGQQYINNAQMSSTPPSGSQQLQPATAFKVNQKLYVIFDIHSGGKSGVVCLIWYLNGKAAFNYSLPVGANSTSTYAYATYGATGPAYVELYWASNTSCSDEVLAQHVDFNVTA